MACTECGANAANAGKSPQHRIDRPSAGRPTAPRASSVRLASISGHGSAGAERYGKSSKSNDFNKLRKGVGRKMVKSAQTPDAIGIGRLPTGGKSR
jgi:hypothetical protein